MFQQLVPLAAGIIGVGVGYVGGGGKDEVVSNIPAATVNAPAAEAPISPEIPYPITVEGLTKASGENKGARREWLIETMVAKMTASELATIAARIETFPRDEQYPLMPRVMAVWAALDPVAAEQWLIQHAPTYRKGAVTFLKSLTAFASKNPKRSFEILELLPPGERREKLASAAATELAKINPREAAELVAGIRDESARKQAEDGVLAGIAYADPVAALARIKDMPPEKRSQFISTAINRLFSRDVGMGFAELSKLTQSEQASHMSSLAWRYADRAPQAFADYVEQHSEAGQNSNTSYIATYAARAMAATDPVRAIQWAESLKNGTGAGAVASALNVWSTKDPGAAMAWAIKNKPANTVRSSVSYDNGSYQYYDGEGVPVSPSGNGYVSTVIREWSRSDPGALLAWSKTGDGAQFNQEVASALLAPALAEGKVEHAQELLKGISPERQQQAMTNALSNLVQSNPSKAAELLTTLPVNERSTMLYQNLVQNWATTDIAATAAWIEKLPQGQSRDSASLAYAQRISGADPSAAMDWALGTAANEQRSQTLTSLYFQWMRKQPDAAAEWLETAQGISAAERENMRNYKLR